MKLNKNFLIHNTQGEAVLIPSGNADFSGVVRGNKTLGAILELLKKDTTEAEIVAAIRAQFEAPEGAVEADVAKVLAELDKIGALDK